MKRILLLVVLLFIGFFATYTVQRQERETYTYNKCVESDKSRERVNIATKHLRLTQELIVTSDEKAQATIHGYRFPQQLAALKALPPIEQLPIIKCSKSSFPFGT